MINMSTSLNWVYRMPFSLIKPMRQLSSIVETPKIGLFGINEDRNSSFLAGSSDAPDIIRKAMFCDSHNTWSELGFNVLDHISDYGNVRPGSCSLQSIEEAIMPTVQDMARLNMKPLFLGGDHSVTSCFVKALYECTKKPMAIVHFDAHPDFYHNFEDNNSSHASPMARICEHDSACVKLISVGIRALTLHQKEQMTKFNASCVEARHFPAHGSDLGKILSQLLPKGVQVYITFDMDVLEPVHMHHCLSFISQAMFVLFVYVTCRA